MNVWYPLFSSLKMKYFYSLVQGQHAEEAIYKTYGLLTTPYAIATLSAE